MIDIKLTLLVSVIFDVLIANDATESSK
jgi:hypothetical protein